MRITERLVSATELNRNSSDVLARAAAGARLLVVKDNRPIAAIVPVTDLDRLEDLDEVSRAAGVRWAAHGGAPVEALDGHVAELGKTLIGQSEAGELVQLQIAANTLIVGATGAGKSATLSAMLTGAIPGAPIRFIVGTSKLAPPEMMHSADGPLGWVLAGCTDLGGERAAAPFVEAVHAVIDQRRRRFREAQVDTITEYRQAHPDAFAENADVIIILDEPGSARSGALGDLIVYLLNHGEDLGVFLWVLTQCEIGRESAFRQRIAHRTNSREISRLVIGSDKAKWLQTGEAFLAIDNQDVDKVDVTRFRVKAPNTTLAYRLGADTQDDYENLQTAVVAQT